MNLIEAISKLDARLLRDEQGHEIKGPYWVNRNDVIELLLAAQTPSPATGRAQDPVGCECDEFPECTHVLYFYLGVKHAEMLNAALCPPLIPRCQERHPGDSAPP
jgi:hypothetical protein